MDIAVLLYPDMTALDAIGPYEILSRLPGATLTFVAEKAGPITTDTGFLTLTARASVDDVKKTDILVVPGGPGDEAVRNNAKLVKWVHDIHETTTWTTSVCTGSLILGKAGLLDGIAATSHWTALDTLAELGAKPTLERVVEQGRIVTAAGVSSGIDMALRLTQKIAGDEYAQGLQLGIEYDPQPPFDCGSPEKAPAEIVDLVRATMVRPATQATG